MINRGIISYIPRKSKKNRSKSGKSFMIFRVFALYKCVFFGFIRNNKIFGEKQHIPLIYIRAYIFTNFK